jgi:hypothetical protein
MNGCQLLFRILKQPDLFHSLSFSLKRSILDVLFLIMQKNIYNIARLQFSDLTFSITAESSFCRIFLKLLETVNNSSSSSSSSSSPSRPALSSSYPSISESLIISKKIIKLIGLSSSIGMSQPTLRKFLTFLRTPSELTLSLLHAMNAMFHYDIGSMKSFPSSFFTFGGPGAGLFTSLSSFPFTKEYQIALWFRCEDVIDSSSASSPIPSSYHDASHPGQKAFNCGVNNIQHLISWQNPAQKGLDVYLENNFLVIAISNHSKNEPTLIKIRDHPLERNIWYHFSLKHSKPGRINFFSNDELIIQIDNEIVYSDNFRFPNLGNLIDTDFAIGRNFNGQISPIYFFHEILYSSALTAIMKVDAGRGYDSWNNHLDISIPADLIKNIYSPLDRKLHGITSKVSMAYHPLRCHNGFAIDIHSGRHAVFGNYSQPWTLINPRELFMTMGGISCLIPLFPKLLVENDAIPTSSAAAIPASSSPYLSSPPAPVDRSLTSSPSPLRNRALTASNTSSAVHSSQQLLDDSLVSFVKLREEEEYSGVGYISLLLSILSKCLKGNRLYQQQLFDEGGIEMIEYVLQCVSSDFLEMENDKCINSLIRLKLSSSDYLYLEMKIIKCLLCNIRLWFASSFPFLINLLPLIIAEMKAKPEKVLKLMKINELLDCLLLFEHLELDEDEEETELIRDSRQQQHLYGKSHEEIGINEKKIGIADTSMSGEDVDILVKAVASKSLSLELSGNTNEGRGISNIRTGNNASSSSGKMVMFETPLSNDEEVEESNRRDVGDDHQPISILTSGSYSGSHSREHNSSLLKEAFHRQDGSTRSSGEFPGNFPSPTVSLRSRGSGTSADRASSTNTLSHGPPNSGAVKRMKSFKVALSEVMAHSEEEEQEQQQPPSQTVSNKLLRRGSGGDTSDELRRSFSHYPEEIKDLAVNLTEDLEQENTGNGIPLSLVHPSRVLHSIQEPLESKAEDEDDIDDHDNNNDGNETPFTPKSNPQRKQLRDYLLSMIIIFIRFASSEKDIIPLIDFLAICKNRIILNEIANAILYLLVDNGNNNTGSGLKLLSSIVSACGGLEEFASFIIVYLIHQPLEELRCTGIRILTHFYAKTDSFTSLQLAALSTSNNYYNQKKRSLQNKGINTTTGSGGSMKGSSSIGLQRLQLCGGLALLCEILSFHSISSTEITYTALLELLLTRIGGSNPFLISYMESMEQIVGNSATFSSSSSSSSSASTRSNSVFNAPLKTIRTPITASHYIAAETSLMMMKGGVMSDETAKMTNDIVLPIFFEILPKLPFSLYDTILCDLLALVKHSEGNCEAFSSSPSWHLCMFGLVESLVNSTSPLNKSKSFHTYELIEDLEKLTGIYHSHDSFGSPYRYRSEQKISQLQNEETVSAIRSWRSTAGTNSTQEGGNDIHESTNRLKSNFSSSSFYGKKSLSSSSALSAQNTQYNLWFDLGMKIYSTLLLYSIDYKNGWKEIDRSISSSFISEIGYSISQTIMSHLLNELTFSMKSKYKELQRLVRSSNSIENQLATDKLENLLCILLTASDISLINQQILFSSIPNYQIALLRVQIYNELSKDKRAIRSEKVYEIEGSISFTEKDSLLPFSTLELRHLLNETEKRLYEKLEKANEVKVTMTEENEEGIAGGDDNNVIENGSGKIPKKKETKRNKKSSIEEKDDLKGLLEEHLDLFHIWYDITSVNDSSSFIGDPNRRTSFDPRSNKRESTGGEGGSTEDDKTRKADTLLSISAPSQMFKTAEELLHPLERVHEVYHGKLILVLQSLRLFDVMFWPTEESTVRNNDMLRFSKEILKATQQQRGSGTGNEIPSMSDPNKLDNPKKQMTIFSATMRMCIFTLIKLSPTTHLAVHNIKRMRALIKTLDKVSSYNTPTYDWLLAAIAHITINIQRLMMTLAPAFVMIGISMEKLAIPLIGPWLDSYDEFDKLPNDDNEAIFKAMADPEVLQQLHLYFNSSPGRNLIRNLRASLHFLMDAFTLHSGKLSSSLEERCYRSLWILVEQMRADTQIIQQLPPDLITPTTSTSLKHIKKYNSMNRFDLTYSLGLDVVGTGDIYDGNANNSSNSPISPLNFLTTNTTTTTTRSSNNSRDRASSDTSNEGIINDQHQSPIPSNERRGSFSIFAQQSKVQVSSSPSVDSNPDIDTTTAVGGGGSKENENEKKGDKKEGKEAATGPSLTLNSNDSFVEETFNGYDILMMLKWLRYPFFHCNIFRNIQVIKSLQALDYLEGRAIYRFSWESQTFKQELEEYRDIAIKSVEEMAELKELSREVYENMIIRTQSRNYSIHLQENLKIRKVAQRWNDCLEYFELDWSPWKNDLNSYYHDYMISMNDPTAHSSLHGIAYYELAKHRDTRFRNLLLVKLSEPIDHKENAYLDSKVKDQLLFLSSSGSHSSTYSLDTSSSSSRNNDGGVGGDATAGNFPLLMNGEVIALDEEKKEKGDETENESNERVNGNEEGKLQENGETKESVAVPETSSYKAGTVVWNRSRKVEDESNSNNNNNSNSNDDNSGVVGREPLYPLAKENSIQLENSSLFSPPPAASSTSSFLKSSSLTSKFKIPQFPILKGAKSEYDLDLNESIDDLDDNKSDSNKSDLTGGGGEGGRGEGTGTLVESVSKTFATFFQNTSQGVVNNSSGWIGLSGIQGENDKQRPLWTYLFSWQNDEKMLYITDVTRIQLDEIIAGTLILTNKCIYFHYKKRLGGLAKKSLANNESLAAAASSSSASESTSSSHVNTQTQSDKRWYLDRLLEVYGRRYLSQNCGIELFFADSTEVFLAFPSHNELTRFFKLLRNQTTPLLITSKSLNPRYIYKNSNYTELWKRRLISNFEYLMKLNIISGRSYNDITQYPVFPWILSNYLSNDIDLKNIHNYRDLSKPVGALNEDRLKEFKERYNSFYDDIIPKFMYGSHYSSAGVVLHYMVRQEPYTTLAINLQSGRFDCPDRIFFNLSKTWNGCNQSMSDVKELIPEMFYCPEIFINSNHLPLGELQDGNIVDSVILPQWCNNNPYEFIRIHREALESDYVSEHLHEWIDLIFGYKQQGDKALEANNVFYYLTYENSIDISAIEDPLQRAATKSQVIHFGQTPSQLLNKEHPKRLTKEECFVPLCSDLLLISKVQIFTPFFTSTSSHMKNHSPILSIRCFGSNSLLLFHANYNVESYRWNAVTDHDGNPFTIKYDKSKSIPFSSSLAMAENMLKGIHIINANYQSVHSSHGTMTTTTPGNHSTSHHYRNQQYTTGNRPLSAPSSSTTSIKSHRLSIDNSNLLHHQGQVEENHPQHHHKEGNHHEEESFSSSSKPTTSKKSVKFEDISNDIVSPPVDTSHQNSSSVFSSIKNSFFSGRRKALSMNLTSPPASDLSSHSSSIHKGSSDANGTELTQSFGGSGGGSSKKNNAPPEGSTSLYNAMRRSSLTSNASSSSSSASSSVKSTSSSSSHAILDTCYNGLSPMSAKLVIMNNPDSLSQGRVITAGYWDNTIKVHSMDGLKEIVSLSSGHLGAVTCLDNGQNNSGPIFCSGGFDGTIRIWILEKSSLAAAFKQESFYAEPLPMIHDTSNNDLITASSGESASSISGQASLKGTVHTSSSVSDYPEPSSSRAADKDASSGGNPSSVAGSSSSYLSCIHVLCGHTSPITSLSLSNELDLIFSGGSDGLLCVHTVRQGQYIRCMTEMIGTSVDVVYATSSGYLIAHSWSTLQLLVYWTNGQLLISKTLEDR